MTQSVAPRLPQDRFALPGQISSPDSAAASPPVTNTARPATHPAGRGWVPLSRDLGIPSEHGVEDPVAALGHGAVFTRERRIRFLDHLAMKGNVRAAAMRVGVSHETAYRARRQDAAFAALWDAALVHARSYAEQVLATRALDGVEVPIVYHGEVLGHQVRHDPRLLLAHIARLDRHVEENLDAVERAGRFDELLATYAGHPAPPDFAQAAEEAHGWNDQAAPDLPPTRRDYVVWRRSEEIGGSDREAEARRMAAATRAAGEQWDDWHDGALHCVRTLVEGEGDPTPPSSVIPAKAGTQGATTPPSALASRLRGNDEGRDGNHETARRNNEDSGRNSESAHAPSFVIPAKAGGYSDSLR